MNNLCSYSQSFGLDEYEICFKFCSGGKISICLSWQSEMKIVLNMELELGRIFGVNFTESLQACGNHVVGRNTAGPVEL